MIHTNRTGHHEAYRREDPIRNDRAVPTLDGRESRAGGWRNPPFAVRVALVASVWAVPGVLAGLLAAVVPVWSSPIIPVAAMTTLAVAAGTVLEASS
jgi:hypothetical protein